MRGDSSSILCLTIGDPAGIGPEIAADLISSGIIEGTGTIIVGNAESLFKQKGIDPGLFERIEPEGVAGLDRKDVRTSRPLIVDIEAREPIESGRPSAEGGRISARAIEIAVELVKMGVVDAIVTGPISKEALSLASYPYRGHTSMFSKLFDAPDCQMVMVAGSLRVLLLTRDMPLAEVPGRISGELIEKAVMVASEGLKRWWGIEKPRIAISALNPHAGDGGVLGREEIEIIEPAVDSLRSNGVMVEGPFPADTMFVEWEKKDFDLFIVMYHDQGMIPFKMVGFESGVNVTIGLPVIRTSVSHGTAYDIVGKGRARSGSLIEAFKLARKCAIPLSGKEL